MSTCFLCFTDADMNDDVRPALTIKCFDSNDTDPLVGGFVVHKDCFINDEELGNFS